MYSDSDIADILIVGAGPAGCAASVELARAGLVVEMIDRADPQSRDHAGETLASDIAPLLMQLGVWEQFRTQDQPPCFGMQTCWGTTGSDASSCILSPYGHGWHVDRQRLDSLLAEQAKMMGVSVHRQSRIRQLRHENGTLWEATVENGSFTRKISSRFLIDASGRNSPLRNHLGAKDHVHDHLVGVGAWFDTDPAADSDQNAALIEATEQGWWYSAPTSDNARRIAVFMTDLDLYRHGRSASGTYWQQRLLDTEQLRRLLRGAPQPGPLRTYVASSHQVLQLGQSGWLPVGDALQSVDPLSGRGVENAIQSGIDAAAAYVAEVDGRIDAITDYLQSSQRSFSQYLVERLEVYGMEDRWRQSTFWRRRTGHAVHGTTSETNTGLNQPQTGCLTRTDLWETRPWP